MMGEAPCDFLDWDSQFFHRRIALLKASRLTPADLERVLSWCAEQSIDCLYFLADAEDALTVSLAEAAHFHFVDIRLTYEITLAGLPPYEGQPQPGGSPSTGQGAGILVRPAEPADIPALKSLAGALYHDSRFYYDGHFSRQACDALYETWIENSCRGQADRVLVATGGSGPVGYMTCHLGRPPQMEGQLGLLGVAPEFQGQGLGRRLTLEALGWLAGAGMQRASLVTQGRNCRAQRLYQKLGFVIRSVALWYHLWLDEEKGHA